MNDYDAWQQGFPSLAVWQEYDAKIARYELLMRNKYPSLPNPYTWDRPVFYLPVKAQLLISGPDIQPDKLVLEFHVKKYQTSIGTTKSIWIQRDA